MDETGQARNRILIVDDSPEGIKMLANALPRNFVKQAATSGERALRLLEKAADLPDLILLDVMMPGMDGFEVCRVLKEDPRFRDIPVIFLSGRKDLQDKLQGLAHGAVDYITKPFKVDEVRTRVDVHLRIRSIQRELERRKQFLEELVEDKARALLEMQLSTIYALIRLTEHRDEIIGGHLERTQRICVGIAQRLAELPEFQKTVDAEFIDRIYKASPLHDIGKMSVPDGIYLKPGRLTPEEFEIMKTHTTVGVESLVNVLSKYPGNDFIRFGVDIARTHHEKWNGTGYPVGLAGEDIPLSGRIMAVADVFDALRTRRPYKEPISHEDSISIVREGRGIHFDPRIVDAFLELSPFLKTLYP